MAITAILLDSNNWQLAIFAELHRSAPHRLLKELIEMRLRREPILEGYFLYGFCGRSSC